MALPLTFISPRSEPSVPRPIRQTQLSRATDPAGARRSSRRGGKNFKFWGGMDGGDGESLTKQAQTHLFIKKIQFLLGWTPQQFEQRVTRTTNNILQLQKWGWHRDYRFGNVVPAVSGRGSIVTYCWGQLGLSWNNDGHGLDAFTSTFNLSMADVSVKCWHVFICLFWFGNSDATWVTLPGTKTASLHVLATGDSSLPYKNFAFHETCQTKNLPTSYCWWKKYSQHLLSMKPMNILHINWCRISSVNRIYVINEWLANLVDTTQVFFVLPLSFVVARFL